MVHVNPDASDVGAAVEMTTADSVPLPPTVQPPPVHD